MLQFSLSRSHPTWANTPSSGCIYSYHPGRVPLRAQHPGHPRLVSPALRRSCALVLSVLGQLDPLASLPLPRLAAPPPLAHCSVASTRFLAAAAPRHHGRVHRHLPGPGCLGPHSYSRSLVHCKTHTCREEEARDLFAHPVIARSRPPSPIIPDPPPWFWQQKIEPYTALTANKATLELRLVGEIVGLQDGRWASTTGVTLWLLQVQPRAPPHWQPRTLAPAASYAQPTRTCLRPTASST